jgi:hypothetical protein
MVDERRITFGGPDHRPVKLAAEVSATVAPRSLLHPARSWTFSRVPSERCATQRRGVVVHDLIGIWVFNFPEIGPSPAYKFTMASIRNRREGSHCDACERIPPVANTRAFPPWVITSSSWSSD